MDDIIIRLKEGNETAFTEVYNRYSRRLHYFANEYLQNSDESMDIVQNVFIQLYESAPGLDADSNLEAFLITSTKNACISQLRKNKVRQQYFQSTVQNMELELNLKALEAFEYSDVTFNEVRESVKTAIEELPPKCKEVFLMSRQKQMKYQEIAEVLDVSKRTVERRMTEALGLLKSKLKEFFILL
ncbi:MAG: RNA polymerase sigma-70 factor, partial [Bacteroidales bacterium]